eukprot:CAMPEP_0175284902 /NCGR_PEP_ID=MMETSP0093-20121207/52949_1 /TAXON_ID=311494 /ORGANISM="Alexandrium monilatum, Strain CCMP3105" /LENGTH=39 /DNA_ID= /DNA_START= /DNA_END= /DNA_ORIENTATION=
MPPPLPFCQHDFRQRTRGLPVFGGRVPERGQLASVLPEE